MDKLSTIYEIFDLLEGIQRYLWIGGLVLALLNCFFGYRLRKLWGVCFGFFLGAGAGLALAAHQQYGGKLAVCLALGLGLFLAFLAFLLYRLGLFFLCSGLTGFFLWKLLPSGSQASLQTKLAICILVGCCAGVLALIKERLTVSLATAIGGAWASAWFLCQLCGLTHPLILVLITLLLGALGILVQLKPWQERDDWDSEDEKERRRERDRKRAARRRRRNRRREKNRSGRERKREAKQKKRGKRRNKRSGSSDRSRKTDGRNAQYDGRDAQHDNRGAQHDNRDAQHDNRGAQHDNRGVQHDNRAVQHDNRGAQQVGQRGTQESEGNAGAASATPPSTGSQRELPDLTDIRAQLSQEVSAIYQEEHSSDA